MRGGAAASLIALGIIGNRAAVSYVQGINFRNTVGYVTDGADDYVQTGTTANYPTTTSQGNVVGWEDAISTTENRNSSVDARLAGVAQAFGPTISRFRLDLPVAGTYRITLAAGDVSFANWAICEIFDNVTSKGVLCNQIPGAGSFCDATDTVLTAANWPSSNTSVDITFASTICRLTFGDGNGAHTWTVAHLKVEKV